MKITTDPESFCELFNWYRPEGVRRITAEEVRLWTRCGLIGRPGYYAPSDFETVMGLLRLEALQTPTLEIKANRCKLCHSALPSTERKRGRPPQFCEACQPKRLGLRYRRWKAKVKRRRRKLEPTSGVKIVRRPKRRGQAKAKTDAKTVALTVFENYLQAHGKSPVTISRHLQVAGRFIAFSGEKRRYHRQNVGNFLAQLRP